MTEFTTSATLDLQVSPSSIRDAEKQIEKGIDPTISVETTTGGSRGGRGSKENRHWRENLDLNRGRNDLLRQLVDVTEKDAQTTRGRGGGLAGGALGLAIGGVGLGSMLLDGVESKIGDALPDLKPSDVIDPVATTAADVIDSAAELSPGDAIASAATVTPTALVTAAASVTPSDVVAEAAKLSPGDVVAEAASLSPADLVTKAATVTPAAVIAAAATVTASNVIDSLAEITPGDVISAAVELAPGDIVSGTISASDILDRVVDPSVDGSTALAAGGAAGAATAAGAAAKRYGTPSTIRGGAGRIGQIGKGSAGVSTPVITRGMTGLGPGEIPDLENGGTKEVDMKSNKEWIRDALSGPADPNAGPTAADDPNQWKSTSTNSTPYPGLGDLEGGGSTEATVEQNNNIEINADTSDLRREVDDKIRGLEKDLSDLERELSR